MKIMKKPIVDRDECQGHAECVAIAPEVFELDDDGMARVKNPEGASEKKIQKAIDTCPAMAIGWEEEE